MERGKFRSKNQILEDQSIRIFLRALPKEWIWRMLTPDYGIDFEIELVKPETETDVDGNVTVTNEDNQIVTGDIIWVQLKSTDKLEKKDDLVKYPLESDLFIYASGCKIPILLVLVETSTEKIYWKHIQKYIRDANKKEDFRWWMNKSSTTIYLNENKCILNSDAESFDEWGSIAKESGLIRELAVFLDCIYECRSILTKIERKYNSRYNKKSKKLLKKVLKSLNQCWCSGIMFFDFDRGINFRKRVLEPIIDKFKKLINNRKDYIDICELREQLDKLAKFASEWVNELTI